MTQWTHRQQELCRQAKWFTELHHRQLARRLKNLIDFLCDTIQIVAAQLRNKQTQLRPRWKCTSTEKHTAPHQKSPPPKVAQLSCDNTPGNPIQDAVDCMWKPGESQRNIHKSVQFFRFQSDYIYDLLPKHCVKAAPMWFLVISYGGMHPDRLSQLPLYGLQQGFFSIWNISAERIIQPLLKQTESREQSYENKAIYSIQYYSYPACTCFLRLNTNKRKRTSKTLLITHVQKCLPGISVLLCQKRPQAIFPNSTAFLLLSVLLVHIFKTKATNC